MTKREIGNFMGAALVLFLCAAFVPGVQVAAADDNIITEVSTIPYPLYVLDTGTYQGSVTTFSDGTQQSKLEIDPDLELIQTNEDEFWLLSEADFCDLVLEEARSYCQINGMAPMLAQLDGVETIDPFNGKIVMTSTAADVGKAANGNFDFPVAFRDDGVFFAIQQDGDEKRLQLGIVNPFLLQTPEQRSAVLNAASGFGISNGITLSEDLEEQEEHLAEQVSELTALQQESSAAPLVTETTTVYQTIGFVNNVPTLVEIKGKDKLDPEIIENYLVQLD